VTVAAFQHALQAVACPRANIRSSSDTSSTVPHIVGLAEQSGFDSVLLFQYAAERALRMEQQGIAADNNADAMKNSH
jgi:hypothetical protein